MDQIPAGTPFMLAAAFMAFADNEARATAHTPVTVKVTDVEGSVTYRGEPLYYAVTGVSYDAQRDEYVLEIDESQQAKGACQFTQSHTRAWCGNSRCRER